MKHLSTKMHSTLEHFSTVSEPNLSAIDVSRRMFVGGTAALGAVLTVSPTEVLAATPTFSANAFYMSVGICAHPSWLSTNWGTLDWPAKVIESGVPGVRGEVGHNKGVLTHLQELFNAGIQVCALIPGKTLDRTAAQADVNFLGSSVGSQHLSGIESINEYNDPSSRPVDWAAKLRDFHAWLANAVKANASLRSIPVVAPSMWGRVKADYQALGNLEPNVGRDNMHYYPAGQRPTLVSATGTGTETIQQAIADAHIIAPQEPLYVTEYGYDTPGPNLPLSNWVVTQRAAAKYIVRGLFDLFANGAQKTFIYELMDDPGKNHYWGLCDASLKPKLQFTALKNTVALFKDNSPRVASLGYTLDTTPPSLKQYVFSKSDGSFLLVLYRDIDSYNRTAHTDIDAAITYVIVNLSISASKIEVYRPTFQATSQGSATGKSIMVPVDDQVTVVRVTP